MTLASKTGVRSTHRNGSANLAVIYALMGDGNKAFQYLEKAFVEQELMAVIRFPAFDVLHSDTRYPGFMRRLGLPD